MEVQASDRGDLPQRSRYYHANICNDTMSRGEPDYRTLRPAFVIFVCTFDRFGRGLHRYTFRNGCAEVPGLGLGDGATTVFLSTRGDADDVPAELADVLSFVERSDLDEAPSRSPLVRDMGGRLGRIYSNPRWREEYMLYEIRMRERYEDGVKEGFGDGFGKGHDVGVDDGARAKAEDVARRMLAMGMPVGQIAACTQLPPDDIEALEDGVSEDGAAE